MSANIPVDNCVGGYGVKYYGKRVSDGSLERYSPEHNHTYSKVIGRRSEDGWASGESTFNTYGLISASENPAWFEYVNSDRTDILNERETMRGVAGKKYVTTNPEIINAAKLIGRVRDYNPYIIETRGWSSPTKAYETVIRPIVLPTAFRDNSGRSVAVYELPENMKFQPHNSFDNIKSQRNLKGGETK
jgi:hypothetical protein